MAQDDWILDQDVVRGMDIAQRRRERLLKMRRGEIPYPTREQELQADPHQKHLREDRLKRLREERATRESGSGGRGGPFRPPTGFPEDDEDPGDILVIVQAILDTVGWTQSRKIGEIKTLLGVGGRRPRGFSK